MRQVPEKNGSFQELRMGTLWLEWGAKLSVRKRPDFGRLACLGKHLKADLAVVRISIHTLKQNGCRVI